MRTRAPKTGLEMSFKDIIVVQCNTEGGFGVLRVAGLATFSPRVSDFTFRVFGF